MISIKDKCECTGCEVCCHICPNNSISMACDEEGFRYPLVDMNSCLQCNKCNEYCPQLHAAQKADIKTDPIVYAAWNQNQKIRNASSSGGIFTAISEKIIANNGVVFGAAFDENMVLKHSSCKQIDELEKFRGSKYVQSIIGNSYREAKDFLMEGKQVLFTGTPCQIAGLTQFLNKEYENLITIDMVCHGVPSPSVFQKYLTFLETKNKSKIKNVSFRDKQLGWKNFSLSVKFNSRKELVSNYRENNFLIGFLKNIYLRPSCYSCKYSSMPRIGDITLGDFWGISSKRPELDDDQGTSLVLVNSKKGEQFFALCKEEIFSSECELNLAIAGNSCLVHPVGMPERRKDFFEQLEKMPFKKVMNEFMKPPSKRILLFQKARYFLKKMLKKS